MNLVSDLKEENKKTNIPRLLRHKVLKEEVRVESNIFYKHRKDGYVAKIYKNGDLIKKSFKTIEDARAFRDSK